MFDKHTDQTCRECVPRLFAQLTSNEGGKEKNAAPASANETRCDGEGVCRDVTRRENTSGTDDLLFVPSVSWNKFFASSGW